MKSKTLRDLSLDQLRDLYSAETQLTRARPDMARAATSPAVRRGFEDHLAQTRGHVQRMAWSRASIRRTRRPPAEPVRPCRVWAGKGRTPSVTTTTRRCVTPP
ncbi:YciE/YciF ferroxidase family protein [Deinococcus kurensis]|uniref:YciE/YciF ferroxidase family protein n=1 Tax=Deinococcus kurensis TaxID=2662757 RepID=UPI0035307518